MPKINLSGITPADLKGPGPNLVHMHRSKDDNFQEILGAVGQAGAKWEARSGLAQPGFFCWQYEMTFRQILNGRFSPNLAPKRESVISCPSKHIGTRKEFYVVDRVIGPFSEAQFHHYVIEMWA